MIAGREKHCDEPYHPVCSALSPGWIGAGREKTAGDGALCLSFKDHEGWMVY